MQSPILKLVPCPNCHRLIQFRKLPIHQLMCSTAHLRRSRLLLQQQHQQFSYPLEQKNEKIKSSNLSTFNNWRKDKERSKVSYKKKEIKMKKCVSCMERFEEKDIQYHEERECRHRLVPCIDCDDMFPLSLFNQHLDVCRAKKLLVSNQIQKEECNGQSAFSNLITGIGYVGAAIYNKGLQAASFCQKVVEETRGPALVYLESVRTRIQDTFQDLFANLAYQQNIEGMPRSQIRRIPIQTFKKQPSQTQQQLCTICYCQIQQKQVVKILLCKHIYHPSCIDKWLKINRTCPLCKRDQVKLMMEEERAKEQMDHQQQQYENQEMFNQEMRIEEEDGEDYGDIIDRQQQDMGIGRQEWYWRREEERDFGG